LLKRIQIDFDQVAQSIEENPNSNEVDHGYIMWGARLNTTKPEVLKYLLDFFDQLYALQTTDQATFLAQLSDPNISSDAPNSFRQISPFAPDSEEINFTEHGLNLHIKFDYITSDSTVLGTIGDGQIGRIEKQIYTYYIEVEKTYADAGIVIPYDEPQPEWDATITVREKRYYVVFREQIANGLIKEVTVYNLKTINGIYGAQGVIGRYGRHVETTLEDIVLDPENNNLIIPLQYNMVESYKFISRNVIYADCTLLVLNSVKRTTLPWYTAGWFMFIVMVVVILIAAFSGQPYLIALVAAYGVYVAMIIMILVAVLAQYVFRRIIELYGAKIGIIGAIFLTVVAMLLTRGAAAQMISKMWMTVANYALQAAMILISETNEFLIEEAREAENEYADFSEELAERYEELRTLEADLLGAKVDLNPLLFTSPRRLRMVPNESWDQLRQRTLGVVENTMWTIHDEIGSFHSRALELDRTLPTNAYAT
jgi:hypothetical protein